MREVRARRDRDLVPILPSLHRWWQSDHSCCVAYESENSRENEGPGNCAVLAQMRDQYATIGSVP